MSGQGRTLELAAPYLFVVLWSSAYIAIRASLPDVSPLFFLTIRFALATALLLLVIATIRRTWSSPTSACRAWTATSW